MSFCNSKFPLPPFCLKCTLPTFNIQNMLKTYRICGRHGLDSWVRKIPWRKKWQPLQYSCLENPMDIRTWWATAHGLTESDTTTFAYKTARCTFLYPFTFNILMSLYLKQVSHRQHISGSSFFLIYYGSLSFLADAINFWKYSSLLLQAILFLLSVLGSCVCYSVCSCLTFLVYFVSFFCLFYSLSSFCFCLF